MTLRIFTLGRFLFRQLLFSLYGLLFILLALVYYLILFEPRQRTPDIDYFILWLGLFGLIMAFLSTLVVAARANRAVNFPFLVRLPSRSEYLTATLAASLSFTFPLQVILAILALVVNGPELTIRQIIEIPPLWIAGDIVLAALALHATDLVAAGWSRVYIFGILGIFLYIQSGLDVLLEWLSTLLNHLGNALIAQNMTSIASTVYDISNWLVNAGSSALETLFGFVFWPFRAIADGVVGGYFSLAQALAPAVLLLYATGLFLLASRIFATKDLFLTE